MTTGVPSFSRTFLFTLLATTASTACNSQGLSEQIFTGSTMGTTFRVSIIQEGISDTPSGDIRRTIEAELDGVDRMMSHYRPDSELSRFNAFRDTQPFSFTTDTFEVIKQGQEIAALTDGAFDITVGPLVAAWGFGVEQHNLPPTRATIVELLKHSGHDQLRLDFSAKSVRKRDPLIGFDLSAIAKGYAVDRVASAIESKGVMQYMIEVGGEVRTRGLKPSGEPWRIGIQVPDSKTQSIIQVVPLRDMAMATSGDYRSYYEVDGQRISHTIDPRTGYPVTHALASVTVVGTSCSWADGMATALNVLGPTDGYRFAVAEGVAALMLVRTDAGEFDQKMTPAFEHLLQTDLQ